MQNFRSNSGGAAMALGQRYQARVTAWWAARLLLQTSIGGIFDISPTTIAERISAETRDQIDDLRVNLSNSHLLFGQCKTSIDLSSKVTSKWASVLKQFYSELQYDVPKGVNRFFVVYYEKTNKNLEKLGSILKNYRDLDKGASLLDVAFSKAEISLVNDLESLLNDLQQEPGFEQLKDCREELLRHIHIEHLELKESSPARIQIIESLQYHLLYDHAQVFEVLTYLHVLADNLLAERGSKDRLTIRRKIGERGVRLRDSLNYQRDFDHLKTLSETQLDAHFEENRHRLVIGDKEAIIDRPAISAIVDSVKTDSFFIVGDAGVGKTGCVLSAVKRLQNEGYRVWYWAADSLPYSSVQEIGNTLNLHHEWKDLFQEASSSGQTVLIIDGLDGLRDSNAQRAYRELLRQAHRSGIKVAASIRTFDLLYSPDLKEIFVSHQPLDSDFYNQEFWGVKHLYIEKLILPEIEQAFEKLPELVRVLLNAKQLIPIIYNLFSLDLLCRLIDDGEDSIGFSAIRTQAELFERSWKRRIDNNNLNVELTDALSDLIEQMINSQTLQVTTRRGCLSGAVKDVLFGTGLLRTPPPVPGRIRNENLVEFTHHLLFDYAAEKLYVRPKQSSLVYEFASFDSCAFFIRPSLRLFFLYLWQNGRIDFWEILVSLQREGWTTFQKLPATFIVPQESGSSDDLKPLLKGALADGEDQSFWLRIFQEIISAASFSQVPNLFGQSSGAWWLEFARDLIKSCNPQLVFGGAQLLDIGFKNFSNLSPASKQLFHESAVLLLNFHLDSELALHQNIKLVAKWVCRTYDINAASSQTVVRRLLTDKELRRSGHLTAGEIAEELENVSDPIFVGEIYEAIFGYTENDQSLVSISGYSRIDNFTASRGQEYRRSWGTLAHKFPKFLRANPLPGTRALIKIYRQLYDGPLIDREPLFDEFYWDDRRCMILRPHDDSWRTFIGDDRENILAGWQRFIEKLPPDDSDAEKIWNEISDMLITENYVPKIWKALLETGAHAPQVLATRLWTILKNKNILLGETYKEAERCLKVFPEYLSDEQLREIEETILSFDARDLPYHNPETVEDYLVRLKRALLSLIPENKRSDKEVETPIDQEGEINYSLDSRIDYFPDDLSDSSLTEYQTSDPRVTKLLKYLANLPITQENLSEYLTQIQRMQEFKDNTGNGLPEETRNHLRRKVVYYFKELVKSGIPLDETVRLRAYGTFSQELISFQSVQQEREVIVSDNYLEDNNAYLDAAKGLIQLAIKEKELSQETKDTLQHLSKDLLTSVRSNLGCHMWMLLDKWREFVWETLERWIAELPEQAETQEVLSSTLRDRWFWWLWHRDEERATKLLRDLMKSAKKAQASNILQTCGMLYGSLYIHLSKDFAKEKIKEIYRNLSENFSESAEALQLASDTLFPESPAENTTSEIKTRAVNLIVDFLTEANTQLETFFKERNKIPESELSLEPPQWIRNVKNCYERLSIHLYFSAENIKKQKQAAETADVETQINEWWNMAEPMMDKLLGMPYPSFVFRLIEAVSDIRWKDPARAIHWLWRFTNASEPQGLTYEPRAADKSIEILEETLADHVSLPVGNRLRIEFFEILEAYLQIGWPRAFELSIRIEEFLR
jgi:hypothetical protein